MCSLHHVVLVFYGGSLRRLIEQILLLILPVTVQVNVFNRLVGPTHFKGKVESYVLKGRPAESRESLHSSLS